MSVRVGINGFGRIGASPQGVIERAPESSRRRQRHRGRADQRAPVQARFHLRAYAGTVEHTEDAIIVDGHEIKVSRSPTVAAALEGARRRHLIESTGRFTDADKARVHLDAGRKGADQRSGKKEDVTIVLA